MPNPRKALLFQDVKSGRVDRESHELLWNLFRHAAPEILKICPETFNQVLNLWFIYLSKLTECLLLFNFQFEVPEFNGSEKLHMQIWPLTKCHSVNNPQLQTKIYRGTQWMK